MKTCYLTMVADTAHSECQHKGNNKFYKMQELGNGFWRASYGRIGTAGQSTEYPMSVWESKKNEKLRKGYVEVNSSEDSAYRTSSNAKSQMREFKPIRLKAVREIVEILLDATISTCRRNYKDSDAVSMEQVRKAQADIDHLTFISDISEFNHTLMHLMSLIPRCMGCVDDYLAKTYDQMPKIIMREQNLLDALRSKVTVTDIQKGDYAAGDKEMTILEAFGIKIKPATKDENELIKQKMTDSEKRFVRAWKVTNLKTQKRFDKYLKDAKNKETTLLWHGSDTMNWWGIIQNGLMLRPATSTFHGKMFGSGLYFAPRAKKSIGYTSVDGSYWAKGNKDRGYIALFSVATGKFWNTDCAQPDMTLRRIKSKHADSLWAKAGRHLRNDEVIVYAEEQSTISYLVEIA